MEEISKSFQNNCNKLYSDPDNLIIVLISNRHQFVSVQNSESNLKSIKHGVPQGSVLGTLLLLIYINDLHMSIKFSETFRFADDAHLLHFAKTINLLC